MSADAHPLIRRTERPREASFSHPLNPNSEMHGVSLSDTCGMQRLGVHLVRIPPGKESCIYHTHASEEEFFYILSGRGIAEIDDREYEVSSGDFIGLKTPSVGHHLRNPFEEDLIYLVGGERHQVEIATFPRLGKRLMRVGREATMCSEDAIESF